MIERDLDMLDFIWKLWFMLNSKKEIPLVGEGNKVFEADFLLKSNNILKMISKKDIKRPVNNLYFILHKFISYNLLKNCKQVM